MTTQPATRCSKEIFENGKPVFVLHSLPSTAVEAIVTRLRETCGSRARDFKHNDIDWHYVAGRAVIKFIGDAETEQRILTALRYLKAPVGYEP